MNITELIALAQDAARTGNAPHQILKRLMFHIQPEWEGQRPTITLEWCLVKAFQVPLRTARDIETWVGLYPVEGWLTDQEIDAILFPWVQQFVTTTSKEQEHKECDHGT
jgi:hypothetical protein